jgi:hypothetical protein
MRTWRGSTQKTVLALATVHGNALTQTHTRKHARIHARSHARTHTHTELYAVAPRRVRKLISHDWAAGYVSPFRPTDEQRADEIMARTGACMCPGQQVGGLNHSLVCVFE